MAMVTAVAAMAQSVGLVLSGGGAKGIAHIGVIQALEDNEIPIDYVTGTSMGAIVGGLYAAGFTPDEMMGIFMSKDFSDWSTGVINENLTYYFDRKTPTPSMVKLNFVSDDSVTVKLDLLPSSLINPLPMNFGFLELFTPYTAQCGGDFNQLFVPFRCVASDVFNKRKLVLGSGGLGEAIRASMSFPIVFKPQYINGLPIFDGGIYDNFPVDVMRTTFAPEFVLGVDVSSGSSKIDMNSLVDQVETMIIQDENTEIPDSVGIKMVLSGEGADEVFGGYLYFHKAPDARAFHEETVRKLSKLHLYDCLRANKSLSAWGVEGRVPFLDKEFLDIAMRLNPESKMCPGKTIEKRIVREAFADMLPESVAWRQKEQFSDGVGYSWIDTLKEVTAAAVTDEQMAHAAERFPINPPQNKEEYYYRTIFEGYFPSDSAARSVPSVPSVACSTAEALAWDASFRGVNDPSGRAVAGVHDDAYTKEHTEKANTI